MHNCRYIYLVFVLFVLASSSCGIKEERDECPCYLNVGLTRQPQKLFPENSAWCSVWNGDNKVSENMFTPVVGQDCSCEVKVPRKTVESVIFSNVKQEHSFIAANTGEQMPALYMTRKDVECAGDESSVTFDSFSKQYVSVLFQLNADAMPYKDGIVIYTNGPYHGIALPSMKAHQGTFSYSCRFEDDGTAIMRIPRQGGPGLKVGLQVENNPPAMMDLYRLMLEGGFDWKAESLPDFKTEIGLNSVRNIIEIVDWDIVNLENKEY